MQSVCEDVCLAIPPWLSSPSNQINPSRSAKLGCIFISNQFNKTSTAPTDLNQLPFVFNLCRFSTAFGPAKIASWFNVGSGHKLFSTHLHLLLKYTLTPKVHRAVGCYPCKSQALGVFPHVLEPDIAP